MLPLRLNIDTSGLEDFFARLENAPPNLGQTLIQRSLETTSAVSSVTLENSSSDADPLNDLVDNSQMIVLDLDNDAQLPKNFQTFLDHLI